MDYGIINVLPRLKDVDRKSVERWYEDFCNLMELGKITEDETRYRLAYLVSEGEARKTIAKLKEESSTFPKLEQIKTTLLEATQLTKMEIYDKIKALVIQDNQSIPEFNKDYLDLYGRVSDDLKDGIRIADYLHAIGPRPEACHAVVYDGVKTIEEACKSAEKIQKLLDFDRERGNQVRNHIESPLLPPFIKPYRPVEVTSGKHYQKEEADTPRLFQNYSSNNRRKSSTPNVPVLYHTANSKCYRCGEEGHKGYNCPYDDESLLKLLTQRVNKQKKEVLKEDKPKNF